MRHQLKPLHEQVIAITGASSGIGLATALAAAQQGARVVLIARSMDTLQRVAAGLEGQGAQALAVAADVGRRDEIELAVHAALARFGRIDTWINNAGVSIYGHIEQVSEQDARRLFDTNFWGVFNGAMAALPHLRATGGALINVGSEVSEAAVPLQGLYTASKHAVKGFTDALRIELEAAGAAVAVTLIQPTAVDTPFPEHARNLMSREPMQPKPMLEPAKVALAILGAATSGEREVKVGAMAVLNTTLAKVMPGLASKVAALQIDRQQRNEPPREPDGTLYHAGHAGRIHGRGDENAA